MESIENRHGIQLASLSEELGKNSQKDIIIRVFGGSYNNKLSNASREDCVIPGTKTINYLQHNLTA